MKKIICICLIVALLAWLMPVLCSCGNQSLGLGNLHFTHIHFSDGCEAYCASVEKWYDNELGIEVRTSEYGPIYLAEGTYMLFETAADCPYCK